MSDNGNGDPPSWDDLVQQVQGALEELNLNSPENQSLFVEGLKEAMESLESMGFNLGMPGMPGAPSPTAKSSKKPDIQVFEGGKGDDETEETEKPDVKDSAKASKEGAAKKKKKSAASKKRPDLKVAPPEEKDSSPKSVPPMPDLPPFPGFAAGDPSGLHTMFKVLRLGEDAAGAMGTNPLWAQGKIKLTKGKSAFQNIFRGDEPRPYRIECTKGGLQIYLNGQPAEAIEEGQSTDVEAAVIRVQAANEEDAAGIYTRLLDSTTSSSSTSS